MKYRYSRNLMLATLIVGAATAILYRSFAGGSAADYGMQEFPATPPGVAQNPPAAQARLGSVAEMLAGLEQRLQADGGQAGDWLLLAKSYYHLDRQPQAREAYQRALAMGYSGDWAPLPNISPASAPVLDISPARYAAARLDSVPGPARDLPAAGIRLKVSLAPELKKKLPPDTAVYLFARDSEAAGPPLAAVSKQVRDLPLAISLDDSHSVMPGRTISGAEQLVVGARISVSGSASRQPGDLERLSAPFSAPGPWAVDLYIEPRE